MPLRPLERPHSGSQPVGKGEVKGCRLGGVLDGILSTQIFSCFLEIKSNKTPLWHV